jgi:hypothetical protein
MEAYQPKPETIEAQERLGDFIHQLSETTGEQLPIEYIDGTYEIEANRFTLTFTNEDNVFEIRSIDVRGNEGLGSKIVTVIHDYADECGLEVIASNVLGAAKGLWEKMGYQAGEAEDEYFRVA